MFLYTRTNQSCFLFESHLRKTVCLHTPYQMHITCSAHTFRCDFSPLRKITNAHTHNAHCFTRQCFLSTGYTEKPHRCLRIQCIRQATEDLCDLLGVPASIRAWIWTWPVYDVTCFLPCIIFRHVPRIRICIYYVYLCGYLVPWHMYGG